MESSDHKGPRSDPEQVVEESMGSWSGKLGVRADGTLSERLSGAWNWVRNCVLVSFLIFYFIILFF